jgi:hypothetical protein
LKVQKKNSKNNYIFLHAFLNLIIRLCYVLSEKIAITMRKLRQRSRDCLPLKLYMWHNLRFKNEKHHLCFFISKSVLQFQRQTYTKKDVSVIILVMIMKELEK